MAKSRKLHKLVEEGDVGKLRKALSSVSEHKLNKQNDKGQTLLHTACLNDNVGCVSVLVKFGADVNLADSNGATPAHYAASGGHVNCIMELLKANLDLHKADVHGRTPLHIVVSADQTCDALSPLLNAGARVNALTKRAKSSLAVASESGNTTAVAALLKAGADDAAVDEDGRTPLHNAIVFGHSDIVEILLRNGADTTVKDKDGKLPIDLARSVHGKDSVFEALLLQDMGKSNDWDRDSTTEIFDDDDDEDMQETRGFCLACR
eukprot:GFYU01020520.1.p1 GENE.GFYU01020520.1~~GFYU01020520.1.p1  ORF type:complete len:264 (-),score=50.97 GFYU01020520.1:50-841(-)